MRKLFSAFPLALCVLGVLALYGCSANSPASLAESLPAGQDPEPPAATQHANGVVEDWSTSHVIYPRVGNVNAMMALQHDARALQSWQLAARNALLRSTVPPRFVPTQNDAHRDWSISLGGGSVAPSMYAAKFGFSTSATVTAGSCTTDFAVFPIDVAGGASQPNIVGLDNLYSGTTPTNGICNRAGPPAGDDGVSATTMWSYNVTGGGGIVATSPTLSLDGTKVAFVETGGGAAHFHVLAWKSGDGVDAANLQSVTLGPPKQLTSSFATTAPVAGSGTVTDLVFGSANDTLSSPFIDYTNDLAYVGNDDGVMFRIKNVFCTQVSCSGAVPTLVPSLDTSWPTAPSPTAGTGTINVCTTGSLGVDTVLTGVVVDGGTGNIFVGCSDGKLFGFDSTGNALTTASVTVGSGSATTGGGIVDPPLIDAANHFVYAVAGASGGGTEVVVQASSVDLSGAVTGTLGSGGHFNMHAPAVNNVYLSGGPKASGALLYDWGLDSLDTQITLYAFGFNVSTGVMGTAPADSLPISSTIPVEFSPVTEFENSSNDLLFVSGLVSTSSPFFNFIEYNINSFPTADPPTGGAGSTGATLATAGTGTSGIIVDNASSAAQASSIYYGDLGAGTSNAVKLTQGDLQ